jgi:hypothetical protein
MRTHTSYCIITWFKLKRTRWYCKYTRLLISLINLINLICFKLFVIILLQTWSPEEKSTATIYKTLLQVNRQTFTWKSSSKVKCSIDMSSKWFRPVRRLEYGSTFYSSFQICECLLAPVVLLFNWLILLREVHQRKRNFGEPGCESSEKMHKPANSASSPAS